MVNWISRFWRTSVIGSFLAGLLFLLPVVLTVFIIAWIINFVRGAIGPGTILGDLLTQGGTVILGRNQDTLAFWLVSASRLWVFGCSALSLRHRPKTLFSTISTACLTACRLSARFTAPSRALFVSRRNEAWRRNGRPLKHERCVLPVWQQSAAGVDVLALLASQHIYNIAGERRRLVYLPTAPIPMSGGLVLVAENAITAVPEMKVDDLLKIYVSLGALAPEAMPGAVVSSMRKHSPKVSHAAPDLQQA